MKAIETIYNGYRFRSRLEARWAVFFDRLGIRYVYEPEGYEFEDGTQYLPDFYLPDSRQYFEVKGVMNDKDLHKVLNLARAGCEVVVGYDDMEFEISLDCGEAEGSPRLHIIAEKWNSFLVRCWKCGKYFFTYCTDTECRCCGCKHDGGEICRFYSGHNLSRGNRFDILRPERNAILEAAEQARQARFEHGEKPKGGKEDDRIHGVRNSGRKRKAEVHNIQRSCYGLHSGKDNEL